MMRVYSNIHIKKIVDSDWPRTVQFSLPAVKISKQRFSSFCGVFPHFAVKLYVNLTAKYRKGTVS